MENSERKIRMSHVPFLHDKNVTCVFLAEVVVEDLIVLLQVGYQISLYTQTLKMGCCCFFLLLWDRFSMRV